MKTGVMRSTAQPRRCALMHPTIKPKHTLTKYPGVAAVPYHKKLYSDLPYIIKSM